MKYHICCLLSLSLVGLQLSLAFPTYLDYTEFTYNDATELNPNTVTSYNAVPTISLTDSSTVVTEIMESTTPSGQQEKVRVSMILNLENLDRETSQHSQEDEIIHHENINQKNNRQERSFDSNTKSKTTETAVRVTPTTPKSVRQLFSYELDY